MKPANTWLAELDTVPDRDGVELGRGRSGEPTLRIDGVSMHSRYRPYEEASRLIESTELDFARPILVIGLGLGYHVLELIKRGADVAVLEPDPLVARLALEGPLSDCTVPLGVGSADDCASEPGFKAFAACAPQVFVHPPSARLHPGFVSAIQAALSTAALADERLSIAVVGPVYGGSLPMAGYLEKAFRRLGHRTLYVDNSVAWPVYENQRASVQGDTPREQLTALLTNFMAEWTYARVMEFKPDLCIVMAQAPVNADFPERLRKQNVISAYWFVENWRHMPYWRQIAPRYDYFFHIQRGAFEEKLNEIGCHHHAFLQTACDPDIHHPVELTKEEHAKFDCDLAFAGAAYPNRLQLFSALTDYDFKIWGVGWRLRELEKCLCDQEQRFDADKYARIVAGAKINLNLHASTQHDGVAPNCDAINPRVFEIAALGGFQLCDAAVGLEDFFDSDTELPVYRSLSELRKRLDYFLAHPEERSAYAERARARVLRDHTYVNRAQTMLHLILEAHGADLLRRGLRRQRTIGDIIERVGNDSELGAYLGTLPPDALFNYETLCAAQADVQGPLSKPAGIFRFLYDMREHADRVAKAMTDE